MAQTGYLVISDITGYTTYLKESELEHARDSLSTLLGLLIEYTRSPFTIAKLEGDAVFSHAPSGAFLEGQTLVEMFEGTYLAFRKALELMVINTTCTCNACSNLPNLDLKFFIHYGTFTIQDLGKHTELLGTDVNLLHRLLKNRIAEELGLKAYAAYTKAVLDTLPIEPLISEAKRHRESYADVGVVDLRVQDMQGIWERKRDAQRIEVKPEDALVTLHLEAPLEQPQLWEYITRPEYRTILMGAESQRLENPEDGRTGPGSVYYCAHEAGIAVHTVLDWQPFDQYTTDETYPVPKTHAFSTYRLQPIEGGTRLSLSIGRMQGPWLNRTICEFVVKRVMVANIPKSFQSFLARVDEDLAAAKIVSAPKIAINREEFQAALRESLPGD